MSDTSTDTGTPIVRTDQSGRIVGNISTGLEPPTIPDQTPGTTAQIKNLEQLQKDEAAEQARFQKQTGQDWSRLRQIESQRPRIPTQQQLGPPPDAKEYQKHTMAWAGAMAMIGALSAKAGRMSGQQAMDAFSGALKGWHEGNLEAYTEAAEKWKATNYQTLENNRQLLEKYQMVMDDHRMNIDQQKDALLQHAVEHRDTLAYNALKSNNMTLMAQLMDSRYKLNDSMEAKSKFFSDQVDIGANQGRLLAQQWAARVEANPSLEGERDRNGVPLTEVQKQNIKHAVRTYPPGAYGFGGAGGVSGVRMSARNEIIQNYRSTHNGEWPSEEYINDAEAKRAGIIAAGRTVASAEPKALSKALSDLTNANAFLDQFSQSTQYNMDKLLKLAKKTDYFGVPAFQKWTMKGEEAAGDPDVAAYLTQLKLVQTDAARIVTQPNLKGVLSDAARNEMKEGFPNYTTLKQLEAIDDTLRSDFANRRKANDEEVNKIKKQLSALGKPGGKTEGAGTEGGGGGGSETPPVPNARKAPDGNWYIDDPDRPGKYLKVG